MVTINKALDNLIDALAGSDVPVTGTKATRVDQLAEMISDGEIVIGGGGGGYDLVIELDNSSLGDVTAAELVEGTYEAAMGKYADGKPVTALVYGVYDDDSKNIRTFFMMNTYMSDYVEEGEPNLLQVTVYDFHGLAQTKYVATTSGGEPTSGVSMAPLVMQIVTIAPDGTCTISH